MLYKKKKADTMNKLFDASKINRRAKELCYTSKLLCEQYNYCRYTNVKLNKHKIEKILNGNLIIDLDAMYIILSILEFHNNETVQILKDIYKKG